jgi:RNA recognition motif-containing protein
METADKTESKAGTQNKRVFVGNLHCSTTEGDLIKVFSKFGTVTDVNYMWHKFGPLRGKPKGFAFLGMSSAAEADFVIAKLDGVELKGRRLSVSFSDNEHLVVQSSRGSSYSKGDRVSQPSASVKQSNTDQPVGAGVKRSNSSGDTAGASKPDGKVADKDNKKQRRELYTVEERMRRLKEALEGAA